MEASRSKAEAKSMLRIGDPPDATRPRSAVHAASQSITWPSCSRALILWRAFDARGERHRRHRLRLGQRLHPHGALGLPLRGGECQRQQRRPSGLREQRQGRRHAAALEPCGRVGRRGARRRHASAATAQRRRHAPGLVRDQQEERRRWRLLERLQQRIGGRGVHRFGGNDHRDLGAAAVARQLHPVDQRTDAIDRDGIEHLDLSVVLDRKRLDQLQVRMLARGHVTAARAGSARETVGTRRLAQQRAGQVQRERALADSARPFQQHGVRPSRPGGLRLARGIDLPRQQLGPNGGGGAFVAGGHRHHAASNCASSARTSAIGRAEFTMRKRAGSCAARSR